MTIELPIDATRFPVEVVAVQPGELSVTVAELDTARPVADKTEVDAGPTLAVRPILRAADGRDIRGQELEVHLASPGEDVRVGDKIVFGALTASLFAERNGSYRVRLTAVEVADASKAAVPE